MENLTGTIERIVYQNEESCWTVARLKLAGTSTRFCAWEDLTTIVGPLPGVRVGETLSFSGAWEIHPRHGLNFKVESFEPPVTADGIRRYLGSGLIEGIGPKTAERIVTRFGDKTLEVIDTSPERLREVRGVSSRKLETIVRTWEAQKGRRDLMLLLQSHEVAIGLIARIYKTYGSEAINVIRADPYQLINDVRGIGFITADGIALKLGLPAQSPLRHVAGLKHVLSQSTDDGHVYLPRAELLSGAVELLSATPGDLDTALKTLARTGDVIIEPAGETPTLASAPPPRSISPSGTALRASLGSGSLAVRSGST